MYSVEKKPYGCKLTLSGIINQEEMIGFYTDSIKLLDTTVHGFGVLADIRNLEPMSHAAQEVIDKVQRAYRNAGMSRSVVVISNPIIKRQLEEIAKKSGIFEWERYIDASTTPDWEQIGIDWIEKEIDPELKQKDHNTA